MLSLKCFLFGHDDPLCRTPGRMYLQCTACGRETRGWDLSGRPDETVAREVSPPGAALGIRPIWFDASRVDLDMRTPR